MPNSVTGCSPDGLPILLPRTVKAENSSMKVAHEKCLAVVNSSLTIHLSGILSDRLYYAIVKHRKRLSLRQRRLS